MTGPTCVPVQCFDAAAVRSGRSFKPEKRVVSYAT